MSGLKLVRKIADSANCGQCMASGCDTREAVFDALRMAEDLAGGDISYDAGKLLALF